MRISITLVAGVALILAGAFVLLRGGSFTTRRDVVRIGDMAMSAEEQRPIAPWLAGLAVIGGVALAVTASRRKA